MDNRTPPHERRTCRGRGRLKRRARRVSLRDFPFYEEGKIPSPQISFEDFLPRLAQLIWGKRWGAQGIGRLREVAMVRPTEFEVRKLYEEDSAFSFQRHHTETAAQVQEQHLNLARTYEKLGIKVHYSSWSEEIPRSAYGPMKRSISAAAGSSSMVAR